MNQLRSSLNNVISKHSYSFVHERTFEYGTKLDTNESETSYQMLLADDLDREGLLLGCPAQRQDQLQLKSIGVAVMGGKMLVAHYPSSNG